MHRSGPNQHTPAGDPSQVYAYLDPKDTNTSGFFFSPSHTASTTTTSANNDKSSPGHGGGHGHTGSGSPSTQTMNAPSQPPPYIVMTPQMLQMLLQQQQPPTQQASYHSGSERKDFSPASRPREHWHGARRSTSPSQYESQPPHMLPPPPFDMAEPPSSEFTYNSPPYAPSSFSSDVHRTHGGSSAMFVLPQDVPASLQMNQSSPGLSGGTPSYQSAPPSFSRPSYNGVVAAGGHRNASVPDPGGVPPAGVSAYYLTEHDARRMGLLRFAPATAVSSSTSPTPSQQHQRGSGHAKSPQHAPSSSPSAVHGGPTASGDRLGMGEALIRTAAPRGMRAAPSGNGLASLPPLPPPPASAPGSESLPTRVSGGGPFATPAYTAPPSFPSSSAGPPPSSPAGTTVSAPQSHAARPGGHAETENGAGFVVGGWYEGVVKRYNPQRGYGFIKGCYRLVFDAQDCEEACTAYVEDDGFMEGMLPVSLNSSLRHKSGSGAASEADESHEVRDPLHPSAGAIDKDETTAASEMTHERGAAVLSMMQWYMHTKVGSTFPDETAAGGASGAASSPTNSGEMLDSTSPFVKRVRLPSTGCDIFVHHSCISLDNFRALPTYTTVRFCVAEVMGTVQAVDVVPLGPMWCRKTVHPTTGTASAPPAATEAEHTPLGRTQPTKRDEDGFAETQLATASTALPPPLCTISPEAQALLQRHQVLAAVARRAGPAAAAAEALDEEDDGVRHSGPSSADPAPMPSDATGARAAGGVRAVLPSAAIPNALQSLSELDATDAAPSAQFAAWRYPTQDGARTGAATKVKNATTATTTPAAASNPGVTITPAQQKLQAQMAGKDGSHGADGTNSGADGLASAAGMTSSHNVTNSASPAATGSGGRAMTSTTQDKRSSNGIPTSSSDPTTGSSGNGSGPQRGGSSEEDASGCGEPARPSASSKPDTDSNVDVLSRRAAALMNAGDRSEAGMGTLNSDTAPSLVIPTSGGPPAAMGPSQNGLHSQFAGSGQAMQQAAASATVAAKAHATVGQHTQDPHRSHYAGDEPVQSAKPTTLVSKAERADLALPDPTSPRAGHPNTHADKNSAANAHHGVRSPPQKHKDSRGAGDQGRDFDAASSADSGDPGSGSSGADTGKTVTTTTLSSNTIPDSIPGEIADWTDVFEAKMANERAKDILLHKKDMRFFPHQSAAAKEAAEAAAAAACGGPGYGSALPARLPTEVIPLSAVGQLDSSSSRGVENDGASQQELRRRDRSRGGSRHGQEEARVDRHHAHTKARAKKPRHTIGSAADDDADGGGSLASSSHEPSSSSDATDGREHGRADVSHPDTSPSEVSDGGDLPPLVMVPVARLPAKMARQVPEGVLLIALAREMAEKLGIHVSAAAKSSAASDRRQTGAHGHNAAGTAAVTAAKTPTHENAAAVVLGGGSGSSYGGHRTPGPPRSVPSGSRSWVGHRTSHGVIGMSRSAAASRVHSGSPAGGTSGYGSGTSPESINSHPARFVFDNPNNSDGSHASYDVFPGFPSVTTPVELADSQGHSNRPMPIRYEYSPMASPNGDYPAPHHFQHSPWPPALSEPVRPAYTWATEPSLSSARAVMPAQHGASSGSSLAAGSPHGPQCGVAQLGDVQLDAANGATLNGQRLPLFSSPRPRRALSDVQLPMPPWEKMRQSQEERRTE